MPASDQQEQFLWSKTRENTLYYTICLPEANPWPDRANALELLGIYFFLCHNRSLSITKMAGDMGMTRETVCRGIQELQRLGLLIGRDPQPQTWKNAIITPDV